MVGDGLDVAAFYRAVLSGHIGEPTRRELLLSALAARKIACHGLNIGHPVGDVLHVVHVARHVGDMIAHIGDSHDSRRDFRGANHVLTDARHNVNRGEVLRVSNCLHRLDAGTDSGDFRICLRDLLHILNGLTDRHHVVDVVGHGLDLVLERHDDGGGFGVLSRLFLRLLSGFRITLSDDRCRFSRVLKAFNQLFRRYVGRFRDFKHASELFDNLLNLNDNAV